MLKVVENRRRKVRKYDPSSARGQRNVYQVDSAVTESNQDVYCVKLTNTLAHIQTSQKAEFVQLQ